MTLNSLFLIANTAAGSLFGLLFWAIAASIHTQAEVGLGAAYIAALTLLTLLGEMGLGMALIRFAPALGDQRGSLIDSAQLAAALCTLTLASLFALGAPLWSPELSDLAHPGPRLFLFLAATVAFCLSQLQDTLLVAFRATHLSFARNLAANLIRLLFIATTGQLFGAFSLPLAVGVAGLATLAWSMLALAPRAIPGYRPRLTFNWALLCDKLGYTLGNHFGTLIWNLPALVYPLVVVTMLGTRATAQFYMSWMIANMLLIVPAAISTSAFARAANQADLNDRLFWRIMRRTLAGLIPLAGLLALVGPALLRIFGKDYVSEGNTLFFCLIASAAPYTINIFTIVHHRVHRHTAAVIWVSALITLLCLALSIGGGALYGLAGVGAGWLAGQMLGTTIALWSRHGAAAPPHLSQPKSTAERGSF